MSLTEHTILHRRNVSRYKGSSTESQPDFEFVEHVMISELTAKEINRDLGGTRVEGTVKLILWGPDLLKAQDRVELNNGNPLTPGIGDMFEVIKMIKDVTRQANFSVYIIRRLQVKEVL